MIRRSVDVALEMLHDRNAYGVHKLFKFFDSLVRSPDGRQQIIALVIILKLLIDFNVYDPIFCEPLIIVGSIVDDLLNI